MALLHTSPMLDLALHAHFAENAEQRGSDRRVLQLEAHAATPAGHGDIRIYNLSRTGMLVESKASVAVGTLIEVEMPGGARHGAEVVWHDADLFGCRFSQPLSQATLSAALLRAAPAVPVISEPELWVDTAALAKLREHWQFEDEDEVEASQSSTLPLGRRLWVILGLGLASWAVPVALAVGLLR